MNLSYATEVKLLVLWLVVAELVALALTVALMIRKPPPLTTQVDQTTGVKVHGLGWWLVTFSAACTCLPIILLVARTAFALYDWAGPTLLDWWWAPLAVVAAAALGAGGWLLWRWERTPAETDEPAPLAAPEPAQPVQMWGLPADARHGSLPR